MSPTDELIEFALEIGQDEIPKNVQAEASLSFANVTGVAVGALSSEALMLGSHVVRMLGGDRQAHFFGTDLVTAVDRAAFLNGTAAHLLDFDDTHLPTIYHPTATLFGAVLPVAEWRGLSGSEFLVSWVVGIEAGIRVALALGPEHYGSGWHVTATAGTVAAAIASGKALGLDGPAMRNCIGIAATRASGHRSHFGTMTKSGQIGMASAAGVDAALLASVGFTAAADGLCGRRGLFEAAAPHGDATQLSADLGSKWLVLDNRLKPYASGVVTHPLIDAGRELKESGIPSDAIRDVRLYVHPLVAELTGNLTPHSGLEGKFSAVHCFAAGAVLGGGGPDAFRDSQVQDEQIAALRDKCRLIVENERRHMTAAVEVDHVGGSTRFDVKRCRGGEDRPLTEGEVKEKFLAVTTETRLLGIEAASALFQRLTQVANEPSLSTLVSDAILH